MSSRVHKASRLYWWLILVVLAAMAWAWPAHAGSVSIVAVDISGAPAPIRDNYNLYDVLVDTDPSESMGLAQIYSQLSQESYLIRPGSDPWLPPAPPPIGPGGDEYATYVGLGDALAPPLVAGASVDLGSPNSGGPIVWDATTLDASYSGPAGQPTEDVTLIAVRITLSKDAVGFFRYKAGFSGDAMQTLRLPIFGGVIGAPEPASILHLGLALLGLVGLIRLRDGTTKTMLVCA